MIRPDGENSSSRALGIRAKIVLPLAALTITASVLGVVLIERSQGRQCERHLRERASAITHAVAHTAETVSDATQLQRFVTLLASQWGVETIVVASGEPLTVVASSRPEWLGKPVAALPDSARARLRLANAYRNRPGGVNLQHNENGTIDYTLPVRTGLRQTDAMALSPGVVMLHLDGRPIQRAQAADTARLMAVFVSAIGLWCLVACFLLWRIVMRPVAMIAEIAQSAVDGGDKVRVGSSRSDELGQLARQLDRMLDEIDLRRGQEEAARQCAEQSQREAEGTLAELRCLKFALDQHAIVAVTDLAGRITFANDRFCELSKYSREELVGGTHKIINSGYHPPDFWRDMWVTVKRGEVWRAEVCNRAKDGTRYWVDTTVVPLTDQDGRINRYVAIRADITERKLAEANLAEREQQYRSLVNNIPGVPYRSACDAARTIQFIGDAVLEMTGYPASDFVGNQVRTFSDVIHPEDRARVENDARNAVKARRSFSLEYRIVRADGEVRVVSEQGQAVFDGEGNEVRFIDGAIFDISDRKRAEQQLMDERARLVAFVEHAPAAIIMLDTQFKVVAVSRKFIREYQLEGKRIVGQPYYETMPELPQRWKDVNARGMQGEVVACDEDIWQPGASGEDQHLRWEVRPWQSADGDIGGILIFTENITEMKRAEAALRESKEQFELAVRGSNDGIWDWNVQTGVVYYSHRYKELLGYRQHDAFPDSFESFERHLHPEDAPATLQALERHLNENEPFDVTFRLRTATGKWRWFRSRGEAVRGEDGRPRRMAGSISDISSLKEVEQELMRAARLDRLTGLPNRGLFLDRLQRAIDRSDRAQKHSYAVMFLDFDRFKLINDSLGHDAGDALLVEIANKLRGHVRAVDPLSANISGHLSARLGGDEFVVLLDELRGIDDAAQIAQQLLEAFAKPHRIGKHEVYSTASIGIVCGDPSYERAEDVVRDADTAMYEAKRRGKAQYVVFDASMRERVQRHLKLESDLHKAIGRPQLQLCYQPVLSLQNGSLYGVEALLRWRHPTEGIIEPNEFIPIAEESNLILTLGEWVFEEACRQLARWQETLGAMAPKRMCVNLSCREFALPDLAQRIEETLAATGIDPAHIQLEVTEEAFVGDVAATVTAMQSIKHLGIELAIDGFGSGISSFASLHQFPVDVLKIDRSMLIGIEDSNDVASMIHGLAVMVKNLGIDMVAEGVETPGQVIALQELGCEYAQGFFFAEALLPEQMRDYASRSLSLEYNARGAVAYANQWGDRLAVFEPFGSQRPPARL